MSVTILGVVDSTIELVDMLFVLSDLINNYYKVQFIIPHLIILPSINFRAKDPSQNSCQSFSFSLNFMPTMFGTPFMIMTPTSILSLIPIGTFRSSVSK